MPSALRVLGALVLGESPQECPGTERRGQGVGGKGTQCWEEEPRGLGRGGGGKPGQLGVRGLTLGEWAKAGSAQLPG